MKPIAFDQSVFVAVHEVGNINQKLYLTHKGSNAFLIIAFNNVLKGVLDQPPAIEQLIELTHEEALKWFETYLPEEIEQFRALIKENDLVQPLQIRPNGLLRKQIDSISEEFNLTANYIITTVLQRGIEEYRQFLRNSKVKSTHTSFLTSNDKGRKS